MFIAKHKLSNSKKKKVNKKDWLTASLFLLCIFLFLRGTMSLFNIEQSYKKEIGFYEYQESIENSYTKRKQREPKSAKRRINTDQSGQMGFTHKTTPYQKYHAMTSEEVRAEVKTRLKNF